MKTKIYKTHIYNNNINFLTYRLWRGEGVELPLLVFLIDERRKFASRGGFAEKKNYDMYEKYLEFAHKQNINLIKVFLILFLLSLGAYDCFCAASSSSPIPFHRVCMYEGLMFSNLSYSLCVIEGVLNKQRSISRGLM